MILRGIRPVAPRISSGGRSPLRPLTGPDWLPDAQRRKRKRAPGLVAGTDPTDVGEDRKKLGLPSVRETPAVSPMLLYIQLQRCPFHRGPPP